MNNNAGNESTGRDAHKVATTLYRRRVIAIFVIVVIVVGAVGGLLITNYQPIRKRIQKQLVLNSSFDHDCYRDSKGIVRTSVSTYSRFWCPVLEIGKVRFAIPGKKVSLGRVRIDFDCPEIPGGRLSRNDGNNWMYTIQFLEKEIACRFYDYIFIITQDGSINISGSTLRIDDVESCVIIDDETMHATVYPLGPSVK